MTIKSLLIGSAAAIVASTGAQAADVIVAADPEPVEYVQVCDTFGTGYFYIPGESTCLHIGGFVRAQYQYDKAKGSAKTSDYDSVVEIYVDAKSDTEIGTVASHIRMTGGNDTNTWTGVSATNPGTSEGVTIDRAHITIGDATYVNIGMNGSIYDTDAAGEQLFNAGGSEGNQIKFGTELGDATLMLQATALTDGLHTEGNAVARLDFAFGDLGIKAMVGIDGTVAKADDLGAKIIASYMGFGAYYQYSEGVGNDFGGSSNAYGIGWSGSVTDSLSIGIAADFADGLAGVSANDAYGIGFDATYTIVENLAANILVTYTDYNASSEAAGNADATKVRLRLTRSF